jgi:hypothetical protein
MVVGFGFFNEFFKVLDELLFVDFFSGFVLFSFFPFDVLPLDGFSPSLFLGGLSPFGGLSPSAFFDGLLGFALVGSSEFTATIVAKIIPKNKIVKILLILLTL